MARTAFDRGHRPKVGYWTIADEPRGLGVSPGSHAEARRAEAALVATLARRPRHDVPEDAPSAPDPAAVEQLRALGYAQ
jgi:hypothetical protein